jgi:hypothetical protein
MTADISRIISAIISRIITAAFTIAQAKHLLLAIKRQLRAVQLKLFVISNQAAIMSQTVKTICY